MPVSSISPHNSENSYGTPHKADSTRKGSRSEELSPEQKKEVDKLKQRDTDVRAHEMAHVAAAGAYVKGGVAFQYQKGPDGKMYAIGGEVSIDTSPIKGNPSATIAKMETIKRAANAPADPSGADRSVAASATQAEAQARQQLSKQTLQKGKYGGSADDIGISSQDSNKVTESYSYRGEANSFVQNLSSFINISA